MKRFSLIILLSMLVPATISASESIDNEYIFTEVSIQGGQLHASNVKSIINDDKYVWFGTTSGIDRHNHSEHRFWPYPVITRNSMNEDASGCIWIVNETGAYFFDSSIDDFVRIQAPTTKDSRCHAIGEEMWIFSGNKVSIFHAGSPRLARTITLDADIWVMDVCEFPDGKIILATQSGLFTCDHDNGHVDLFSDTISPNPRLVRLIGSTIYVCNYGSGIWKYGKDGSFIGRIEDPRSRYVTDLTPFKGRLWISTDGSGILIHDEENSTSSVIGHVPEDDSSFPTNAVSVLCPDKNGGIWAGSVRYGAFNFHKRYIRTYSNSYPGMTYGTSEKCIVSLFQSEDGTCWIGTDAQGINSLSTESGQFKHYSETFGYPVPGICSYDDKGRILASLFNTGLFLFDPGSLKLQPFVLRTQAESDNLFSYGSYPVLAKTRPDRLFILGSRMYVHDPTKNMIEDLVTDKGEKIFDSFPIFWYSSDFILIALKDELYINRYNDFVLHKLTSSADGYYLTSVAFDRKRNWIWAVTNSANLGYYSYDSNGVLSEFTPIKDIDISGISTITVDNNGRLWISAQGQLYLYEHETSRFKLFSVYDGYEWNDIISSSNTEVKGNTFYLAGTSGLVSVNTDIAEDPAKAGSPVVRIAEVITSRKRYTFNDTPGKRNSLKIPSGCKSLDIVFSVSGLNLFEDVLMKYTISGDTENTVTTTKTTLNLSSLAPGRYTVTATCQGSAITSLKGDTLTLRIAPKWYNSGWFMILLAMLLLGALYLLYDILNRTNATSEEVSLKDQDFLRRFCEYVSLNMDKDLSAETLTKELGISRTLLFEKVKAMTGKTVGEYIKHLRIERATTLLKDSSMSINEISDAVGFSYPRYFSSVFKEVTGMSPSKYKKSNL